MDSEELLDLPEDPELQFVEYERRLRQEMWKNIKESSSVRYDNDQKIYYVIKIMGFHDAHRFSFLQRPAINRGRDDFDDIFDSFLDEVTYWTTQIEVRHSQQLRPIHTIISLNEDIRRQIHSHINKIREYIAPLEIKHEKKEALLSKLNSLADEVDRDRTKTEAWTAFVLEIAGTGGKVAEQLSPIRQMADSIGNLFGKAKELAERINLPSPGQRARLEAPPQRLSPPDPAPKRAPPPATEPDDDIAF
jgi:hypothetical protein